MSKISFAEGLHVCYKQMYGVVRFVSNEYITVCVRTFPNEKVRDVCLVVYPNQFGLVTLAKESTK